MGFIGVIVGLIGAVVGAAAGVIGGLFGAAFGLLGGLLGLLPVVFPFVLITVGIMWLVKNSKSNHAVDDGASRRAAVPQSITSRR
jgi:uncharacterized membrane protein